MKNTVTSINILWIRGTNARCFSITDESENFTHLLLIDQNNACSVTQGLNFRLELMIILVLKYFTLELIHKEALTHYKDFHNNFCQKIIVKIVAHTVYKTVHDIVAFVKTSCSVYGRKLYFSSSVCSVRGL